MTSSSLAVEPAYRRVPPYRSTLGPQVADVARLVGYEPDPEQQMILDALFAVDERNRSVAFETAVIACRQNLKTGVFKQAVLGWLFVTGERLVVWSAHEFATAEETFRDFDELIGGSDWLRREVRHAYRGAMKAFELVDGARLIFKTRTRGGGRGLSGRKVVLDEGFALKPMHMGALLPTMSAQPDPQVVYGSSAGLADSEVLRGIRDRGRGGDEPRLAYFEWCAPDPEQACEAGRGCSHAVNAVGCGCDRPDLWQRANPAMGRRITRDYIAAERRALPPDEFGRERMGWWDDPVEGLSPFTLHRWRELTDLRSPRPSGPALAVDVTPDQSMTAVGVAGRVAGHVHVDVLEHRPGMAWAPARLAELAAEVGACALALYPGGQAGALLPALDEAGFKSEPGVGEWRLRPLSKRELAQACGAVVDDVTSGGVRHRDRPELASAVEGVRSRPMDDAFVFSRAHSTVDICPLMAVTLASWAFDTFAAPAAATPWAMYA